MTVIIAEKRELALAIAKGITSNFQEKDKSYFQCGSTKVIWCSGRMLELYNPEDYDKKYAKWNMQDLPIPIMLPVKKKVIPGKQKQVNLIIKFIEEAKTIINAGDIDEMGQLIIDEVIALAGSKRTQGKKIQRILVNDNSLKTVKKALSNLQDNSKFKGLYLMAESQSIADQCFGFNLSRAYTLASKSKNTMSVGRVQTPILGLIVRRDLERLNHNKSYYYTLDAQFQFNEIECKAQYLFKEGDPLDDNKHIVDPEFLKKIANAIRDQAAIIANKKLEDKQVSPPLPYSLLKLQADCSDILGINMQDTLDITQDLRTKYELITYNRSTCEYLSEEQYLESPSVKFRQF